MHNVYDVEGFLQSTERVKLVVGREVCGVGDEIVKPSAGDL